MDAEKTSERLGEQIDGGADDPKFRATDYGQREQDQGLPKDLNTGSDDDASLIGGRMPVDQEDEDPDLAR